MAHLSRSRHRRCFEFAVVIVQASSKPPGMSARLCYCVALESRCRRSRFRDRGSESCSRGNWVQASTEPAVARAGGRSHGGGHRCGRNLGRRLVQTSPPTWRLASLSSGQAEGRAGSRSCGRDVAAIAFEKLPIKTVGVAIRIRNAFRWCVIPLVHLRNACPNAVIGHHISPSSVFLHVVLTTHTSMAHRLQRITSQYA